MKVKIINLVTFSSIFATVLMTQIAAENEINLEGDKTLTQNGLGADDKKCLFCSKITNNLKASTFLRMNRSHENLSKLQKRFVLDQIDNEQLVTENSSDIVLSPNKTIKLSKELSSTGKGNFESTTIVSSGIDDLKTKIMNDKSFIGFKKFSNQLINRAAKFFSGNKNGESRSYSLDGQTQHQLWDDKDQYYHTSTFRTSEHEPASFYHFIPPPHHYPAQKKYDALLTKVTAIILIKLILAKLKTIGLLKLMFFLMMKIPTLFFKFLIILKGFKLLKLVSVPFIIASFVAPFLPLILLLAPLLLIPVLLGPLLLPLLLPLLFLPIIPVTIPKPSSIITTRKHRNVVNNFSFLTNQTTVDDKWKNTKNEAEARLSGKRKIPISYENQRKDLEDDYEHSGKFNLYEGTQDGQDLLILIRKMIEFQHCMERIACELANQTESKVYHAAVLWALGKIHKFALPVARKKIERYIEGYKTGAKWPSSDICKNKFYCEKSKLLLIQGKSKYKLI